MTETQSSAEELRVPMPEVSVFLRQLSHDLRNHLNAAELQSAYLKEIATEPEIKEEIVRLRAMLGEMSAALQRLTNSLVLPKLTEMSYEAAMFMEDWQQKLQTQHVDWSREIEWDVPASDATVSIDPQLLAQAVLELTTNAFQHGRGPGPIKITSQTNGEFHIRIAEPKADFRESTEEWGRQPFHKVKHGQYGLGLYRARNIIEAHRGRFAAHHDSAASLLVTSIVLPVIGKH